MQASGSYRPDGADAVWRGCCTFVLHMASSSRSQVHAPPRCYVGRLTLEQSSANVHRRTLAAGGIVTQLVTRCRPRPINQVGGFTDQPPNALDLRRCRGMRMIGHVLGMIKLSSRSAAP
jgi:hypothetical protein